MDIFELTAHDREYSAQAGRTDRLDHDGFSRMVDSPEGGDALMCALRRNVLIRHDVVPCGRAKPQPRVTGNAGPGLARHDALQHAALPAESIIGHGGRLNKQRDLLAGRLGQTFPPLDQEREQGIISRRSRGA